MGVLPFYTGRTLMIVEGYNGPFVTSVFLDFLPF